MRVVTVDDQPSFRAVARELVGATPGFEVVAEAASGEDALVACARLQPDLVLVDVTLPGMDGMETGRRLGGAHPSSAIVLMSADDDPILRESPEAYGAVAFMTKQELRPRALRALWDRLRSWEPPRGGPPAA